MQGIATDRRLGSAALIEIRSRRVAVPPAAPVAEIAAFSPRLLEQSRLLHVQSPDSRIEQHHLEALTDPRVERIETSLESGFWLDVFCLPGVTDAEGEMAARALDLAGLPDASVASGTRFRFDRPCPITDRGAVERLLGNPIVHRFVWSDEPLDEPVALDVRAPGHAETIALSDLDDAALLDLSRERHLALDLNEMRAVSLHFRDLGRQPTDVELQSIALAWSEHCCHKTFRAPIDMEHNGRHETIPGLLSACLIAPTRSLDKPWVRSAFVDNAGVIAFDENRDVAFKVETHNHPSALEPYGGAHTGVGGVIRDVLAVSAEPIANTDVLCFGPQDLAAEAVPQGVLHPRRTRAGVVRGVADYGNNMGIPTVGGAVLYHPGYTANPLVFCGTLGIVPRDAHPRDPQSGDLVVLLGGRTGRDGLHGATMSSAALDRETVAGSAVQIGAPITEKLLRDVLPHLRDERLYHGITDCGAGGLCSAVGEMAETLGVDVNLDHVPLKYAGLVPWEIWLSEAQERMVLAVPEPSMPRLLDLCRLYGVEASAIGRFRHDGLLRLMYNGRLVGELSTDFLHGGRPVRCLSAHWRDSVPPATDQSVSMDPAPALLSLLAHPNIASRESIIRRYDHEVGAATVVKPLVGRNGPSDAALMQPDPTSPSGVAVAHGINPLYGERDPYAMALLAVDEALRNLVAIGGSPEGAALIDNFCWGDVDDPAELGALVRAAQGCREAALMYDTPFICGKDSLRNTSEAPDGRRSIPRTLLISAFGVVPDVATAVTMDLKSPDSLLYIVGITRDELDCSHYHWMQGIAGGQVPAVRPDETPHLMRRLSEAIRQGLVLSCHDLSEGGLAVAAAEMAIAGGLGVELDLDGALAVDLSTESLLFSESPGRWLVEIAPDGAAAFDAHLADLPHASLGRVRAEPRLTVQHRGETCVDLDLDSLERAWKGRVDPLDVDQPAAARSPEIAAPRKHAPVRAMVLAAPGVNCDRETGLACAMGGARTDIVHLNQLLDGTHRLDDYGFLVLAGGFSYGDHLGAGTMLATVLRHTLLDDLQRFVDDGRPVLGICNGFQVLSRLGFLRDVALISNRSGRFECRWTRLQAYPSPCVFLRDVECIDLPIAHGEGRLVVTGDTSGLLPLAPLRYLDNPNGSDADIAGVCNPAGNVFGLMPHPERSLSPLLRPDRGSHGGPSGVTLFRNAVRYVEAVL